MGPVAFAAITAIERLARVAVIRDPEDQAAYDGFSLEDAINYAEFLIHTTASYQQFSRSIPGVGGAIDIGLVTPFEDFRWIKQKPLARALGGSHEEKRAEAEH